MSKRKFIILYSLLGCLVVVSYFLVADFDFTDEDWENHRRSVELADKAAKTTWSDFDLREIPIAYRKGNQEFVIKKGEVKVRKPVLPVIAATAYSVDGEFQAFVPGWNEMNRLGGVVKGLDNSVEENFLKQISVAEKNKLSPVFYSAVVIHEAFHVYQLKNWGLGFGFVKQAGEVVGINSGSRQEEIENKLFKLTDNKRINNMYHQEAEYLHRVLQAEEKEKAVDFLRSFWAVRQERRQLMKELMGTEEFLVARAYERYYELSEGTTTYLMIKIGQIAGDKGLVKKFTERLKNLESGKNRFYTLGMGICLALDKWGKGDWHQNLFQEELPPVSLEQVLEELILK